MDVQITLFPKPEDRPQAKIILREPTEPNYGIPILELTSSRDGHLHFHHDYMTAEQAIDYLNKLAREARLLATKIKEGRGINE